MLLPYGNDITIEGGYMFSSSVNPEEESEVTLRVSVAAAPFEPCRFPYRISEHEYALPRMQHCVFVTLG